MEVINFMGKGFDSIFSNWLKFSDKMFESVSTNPFILQFSGQFLKTYNEMQHRQLQYMRNMLEKMNIPTRNDVSDLMEQLRHMDSKLTDIDTLVQELKKENSRKPAFKMKKE
jgi:urate oxidase